MPESQDEILSQPVPIEFIYPDSLTSHFAAHAIAQFQQDHFIVSFFEIFPPAIFAETDEERLSILKTLTHVDARCVARVIMTPAKMREFVQILSDNLAKYQQAIADSAEHKEQ